MTHKTEDDKGEEEEGDGEIYHDAIREEGRTEENSGLEENVKMRERVQGYCLKLRTFRIDEACS